MPDSIMGLRLCRFVSHHEDEMSQPHSLEELLKDFRNLKVTPDTQVERIIESKYWAKRFRDYLVARDLSDTRIAFEFLILTNPFQVKSESNNNLKKPSKDLQHNFIKVAEVFFDEESENQLSLANAKLFDALWSASERIRNGGRMTDKDISLILKAREDQEIWQNGVEPKFIKFLSSVDDTTPLACLLSIL
eukprot:maker-scaffold170_size291898-snap-gene-1.39 protein:Tk03012 transcript:maker-scaffold170_size291898-snap-gene-1.39-mRNA-1 annotation:"hypothetical protein"